MHSRGDLILNRQKPCREKKRTGYMNLFSELCMDVVTYAYTYTNAYTCTYTYTNTHVSNKCILKVICENIIPLCFVPTFLTQYWIIMRSSLQEVLVFFLPSTSIKKIRNTFMQWIVSQYICPMRACKRIRSQQAIMAQWRRVILTVNIWVYLGSIPRAVWK